LEDYQREQVYQLLCHAYDNVPYYRKIFHELGIRATDLSEPLEFLSTFPTLTREVVKRHQTDLLARSIPWYARHVLSSGGTTGEPLRFWAGNNVYGTEWAFIHDMWSRVGFTPGSIRIGVREFPAARKKRWEYDPLNKELAVSTAAINGPAVEDYFNQARRLRASFLHGYPSGIALLARYAEKSRKPVPELKAVLAGSEPTLPWQRELFERVFECPVLTWYGQSEKVILAGECEYSSHYHVYPQYGRMELLDERGTVITEPGIQGELVGTGFMNYAMPLIRYRTGDYAQYVNGRCACGRSYSLISDVEGRRKQHVFVAKDGRMIPATGTFHVWNWSMLENVREFQLEQNEAGKVLINVVPTGSLSELDKRNLLRAMRAWSGDALDFEVRDVSAVKRTARGKVEFLTQNLTVNERERHFERGFATPADVRAADNGPGAR